MNDERFFIMQQCSFVLSNVFLLPILGSGTYTGTIVKLQSLLLSKGRGSRTKQNKKQNTSQHENQRDLKGMDVSFKIYVCIHIYKKVSIRIFLSLRKSFFFSF